MIDKVYIVLEDGYTPESSLLGIYSTIEYAVDAASKALDSVILYKDGEVATKNSIEQSFRRVSQMPVKLKSDMGRTVNIFEQIVDINYFLKK